MPKIKVDKEKCIGCQLCTSICPKTFEMKDDKAAAKKAAIDKLTCEREAADSCPTEAISLS
ncbi:ferredoxin [Candidatus Pacearchaeota archaeon]|nr:ferredoxin [Candidatus Pacearchaeota archaeon]